MIFWNQHNIPYHTGHHKTCLAGFKMAQNGPKMVIKLTKNGFFQSSKMTPLDISQAYILYLAILCTFDLSRECEKNDEFLARKREKCEKTFCPIL